MVGLNVAEAMEVSSGDIQSEIGLAALFLRRTLLISLGGTSLLP